jgi:GNAT superfamily N-acetyltransferase
MKLIMANSVQQKKKCDELTFQAWGSLLSPDQYFEREINLRNEEWCRNRAKTWILESNESQHLASCETYQMNSYIKDSDSESGKTIGIASVFVEPHLRKRGYANRLIEEVVAKTLELETNVHAFILYAEDCEPVYRKNGFVTVDSKEWSIPTSNLEQAQDRVNYIHRVEILDRFTSIFTLPRGKFVVWPSLSQINWHLKRQDLYASFLKRESPMVAGSRVNESYLLWVVDFKFNVLRIVLDKVCCPTDFVVLIESAIVFAKKLGIESVKLWNYEMNEEVRQYLSSVGSLLNRSDSISMIKPVDRRICPKDWSFINRSIWV